MHQPSTTHRHKPDIFKAVWVVILGLGLLLFWALQGCTPAPIQPDESLFCNQDDDCAIGWFCRFNICQRSTGGTEATGEAQPESAQDAGSSEGKNPQDELCADGEERACYTGPTARPLGLCQAGKQFCRNGRWDRCEEQVLPQAEKCNGKDDDCDGQIDNVKEQDTALERSCQNECGEGKEQCVNGLWQGCTAPQPNAELCNGKDDDCDGQIDNHLRGPFCEKQQGVCKGARKRCGGTRGWLACDEGDYNGQSNKSYEPKESRCDGLDNDCNGQVDEAPLCACQEGGEQSCYEGSPTTKGVGPCQAGKQVCHRGQWGSCEGQVLPQEEQCNGKDDNCDGQVDEQLSKACTTSCGQGKSTCREGRWGACDAPKPSAETCNGKDDDCDGQIDNVKGTREPLRKSCQTSCGLRSIQCSKGRWESCPTVQPGIELCNGKDDDCDGRTDEGCYTTRSVKGISGSGFLPALSQDGKVLATLAYEGNVFVLPVGQSTPSWRSRNGLLTSVGFTQNAIKLNSTTSQNVLALAGFDSTGTSRLWAYQQSSQPGLWNQFSMPKVGAPGDLHFDTFATRFFMLDSRYNQLWKTYLQPTSQGWQLQPYAIALKENNTSTTSCQGSRFALAGQDIVVACSGYRWSYPLNNRQLNRLPSLTEQTRVPFGQRQLAAINLQAGLQVARILPLSRAPLDLTFARSGLQSLLLVTTAGLPSQTSSPSGRVILYKWPTRSTDTPIQLTVPAQSGIHARPVGIRATSDGRIFVTIQEYQTTGQFVRGRIVALSLTQFLRGKWTELQSLTTTDPPYYLAISARSDIVIAPSHRNQSTTLHVFKR